MSTKERYQGIQTMLTKIGTDGCLFLCLCSIAEEVNGRPIDLIVTVRKAMDNKWVTDDYTVKDSIALLHYLTGKSVSRKIVKTIWDLEDYEYSICKYHNKRTGFDHFKRRSFDTLNKSVTVLEGELEAYYVYTIK